MSACACSSKSISMKSVPVSPRNNIFRHEIFPIIIIIIMHALCSCYGIRDTCARENRFRVSHYTRRCCIEYNMTRTRRTVLNIKNRIFSPIGSPRLRLPVALCVVHDTHTHTHTWTERVDQTRTRPIDDITDFRGPLYRASRPGVVRNIRFFFCFLHYSAHTFSSSFPNGNSISPPGPI